MDDALPDLLDALTVSASQPAAGMVVVRAVGEIDLATAPEWARGLFDACSRVAVAPRPDGVERSRPAPRLVCDLTAVGFLGAAGLTVLVELAARARSLGVALRLVVDTRVVRRVLELSELDRTVTVERTLLDALDHRRDRVPAARPGREPGVRS